MTKSWGNQDRDRGIRRSAQNMEFSRSCSEHDASTATTIGQWT